jgi:hypothetical protein
VEQYKRYVDMYQSLSRPKWHRINEAYLANDVDSESEMDEDQFNIPIEDEN